jgi:type VI secretion system lysozyme-like protein
VSTAAIEGRTARGLLHRLGSDDPNRSCHLLESIVANLQAILNTHEGDGHTSPEMGVDFLDVLSRWPSSESDVLRAVSSTIERFEPRLRNVRVRTLNKDEIGSKVSLEILADFHGQDRVRLLTELSRGGGIRVR